jgi:hypothetical protein
MSDAGFPCHFLFLLRSRHNSSQVKRLVIGKGRDVGCICMHELKTPHGPQPLFTSRVGLGTSHLGEQIGPELLPFIPRRPDCLGPFLVSRSSITTTLPLLPAINWRC